MQHPEDTTTNPTRLHYWMVAGNVVIHQNDNIQAIPQNAMIVTDECKLGEHQLGKAQQALQLTLFKKLGETAQVVDVILVNMVYLGMFTEEEFHAKPAGVEVQERQPSAEVIDFTSLVGNDG